MKTKGFFKFACVAAAAAFTAINPANADSWERLPDGPGGRAYHSTAFTGSEVIVWGGGRDGQFLADGGAFDLSTKRWRSVSGNNAPSGRWFQTAVWSGKEMILWGGRANFFFHNHSADGGRYDPRTDSWKPMSTLNAPTPRSQFATVWTGSEMIVWGGLGDGGAFLADGGRYNPETDSWTRIAASPLAARFEPTAAWTGSEMIIFGGLIIEGEWKSFGDGARYNPRTDTWARLSADGAPSSRTVHSAVWTGKEMLIWGGRFLPDVLYPLEGACYDPTTDSWTPIPTRGAPEGRAGHAAVWTGKEMIVWGGWTGPHNTELNNGAKYDPASRTWTPTTLAGTPEARFFNVPNAAVWTGAAMFVYGGFDYPVSLNSAYLYSPKTSASAVQELLDRLLSLGLPSKSERPLAASLEAALRSVQEGHSRAAVSQLEAFQRKVETQLRDQPDLAASLIAAAQAIIDSLIEQR